METTSLAASIVASAPGDTPGEKADLAFKRALRTLIQGIAGAFPAAGAGTVVLSTDYWHSFSFACLAALIAAVVSFLQNIAAFLPADPVGKSS